MTFVPSTRSWEYLQTAFSDPVANNGVFSSRVFRTAEPPPVQMSQLQVWYKHRALNNSVVQCSVSISQPHSLEKPDQNLVTKKKVNFTS